MIAVCGALWLMALLWVNVYIEPGLAGNIGCGQVWESPRVEDFLVQDCRRAIDHRRAELPVPIVVIGIGVAVVLLTRKRDRATEQSDGSENADHQASR